MFELTQARFSCRRVGGQIACEGKALSFKTRSHQRQQQCAWADDRLDRDACLVRGMNQPGARIGHARTAGLRHQGGVSTRQQRVQHRCDRIRSGVLVQLDDLDGLNRSHERQLAQKGARGLGALGHDIVDLCNPLDDRCRQIILWTTIGRHRRRDAKQASMRSGRDCGGGLCCQACSGQRDATIAQHCAQANQRQSDERTRIRAVLCIKQADAQPFRLRRSGAIVGGLS